VKKYTFRLETVLKVRRIEEDRAKGALAFANADARRAADEVAVREAAYAALPEGPTAFTTSAFLADRWRRSTSADAVLYGLQREREALTVVAERRTDWSAAAGKVSALERLDSRRREEHALDTAREEAIVVDELVTGRFVREAAR
jgi:flagellar biosynthesis chaperone FliJ